MQPTVRLQIRLRLQPLQPLRAKRVSLAVVAAVADVDAIVSVHVVRQRTPRKSTRPANTLRRLRHLRRMLDQMQRPRQCRRAPIVRPSPNCRSRDPFLSRPGVHRFLLRARHQRRRSWQHQRKPSAHQPTEHRFPHRSQPRLPAIQSARAVCVLPGTRPLISCAVRLRKSPPPAVVRARVMFVR